MAILIIFIAMFLLMFLGMDIFVSMAVAGSAYLLATGNGPISIISNNMVNGLSNMARSASRSSSSSASL